MLRALLAHSELRRVLAAEAASLAAPRRILANLTSLAGFSPNPAPWPHLPSDCSKFSTQADVVKRERGSKKDVLARLVVPSSMGVADENFKLGSGRDAYPLNAKAFHLGAP